MALQLVDNLIADIDNQNTTNTPSTLPTPQFKQDLIFNCLESWIQKEKLAGVSCSVNIKNQSVYNSYHGYSNINTKKPINADTLFRCYSMTKPITAVSLMILFDEGKFKLNDPISKFIPNFSCNKMCIYDYKNNKDLDPNDMKIDNSNIKTIKCNNPILMSHILSHTSGISYSFDPTGKMEPIDKIMKNYFDFHGNKTELLSEVIDNKLTKMPLCFEPGTKWNYSFASDVCGRLVEVLSGMKLNEYFYKKIFEPLNMNNTAFCIDSKYNKLNIDNLSTLYQPSYYGKMPTDVDESEYQNYKLCENKTDQNQSSADRGVCLMGGGSGGGVLSTLGDYMKFAKMLLNNGKCVDTGNRIISENTIKLMTKNYLPNNQDLLSCIVPNSMMKAFLRPGIGFGLGFGVVLDHKIVSKGSFYWGGAASTWFWVDPKKELCVVFMTQLLGNNPTKFDWRSELEKVVYKSVV